MADLVKHGEPLMPSPAALADLQERLALRLFTDDDGGDESDWKALHEDDAYPYRRHAASALNWMRETVQLAQEAAAEGAPRGD